MAIVKCGECGRDVSTQAAACPGCGAPVGRPVKDAAAPPKKRGLFSMLFRATWMTVAALFAIVVVVGLAGNAPGRTAASGGNSGAHDSKLTPIVARSTFTKMSSGR